MAPIPKYYRVWCKNCNNFELHDATNDDGFICRECDTIYIPTLVKDIPEEKVAIQRERYKRSEHRKYMDSPFFAAAMTGTLLNLLSEDWPKPQTIESDCGLKDIEEAERKKRNHEHEEYKRLQKEQNDLLEKHKDVGRNDICPCGSGKKYKKCCMVTINNMTR